MPNTTVCPLAKKCGGCQLQNLSYPEQLHLKQATAIRLLGRFGHVEEILGMDDPYHYRNKVQAAFGVNRQGQIISGVYQSASHRIVPVSDCLIEDKVADRIIVTIRKLLRSFKIRPYDEDTGRGTLRHVLVRRGWRSGEILVVLVTAHGMLPGKRNFVRALLQQHPDITTVVQNINAGQTSLVLGPHSEVLYGPGYIHEQLGDFTFRISPRAFYQINPVQTEVLYRTALDYAGLTGKETVVDAYCGTGTIGIFASRDAARVIGVENNRDAVRDAISNAKANRADNVRFYTADASDFLQGMAKAGEHADVALTHVNVALRDLELAMAAEGADMRKYCLEASKESARVRRAYESGLAAVYTGEITMDTLKTRDLLRRIDVIGLRLGESSDAILDGLVKRGL